MPIYMKLVEFLITLRWPVVIVVALCLFRSPIADAITQVTKGEFFWGKGGEVRVQIEKLATSTSELARTAPPSIPAQFEQQGPAPQTDQLEATVKSILDEASKSPKLALIELSFELEAKAQKILAASGWGRGRMYFTLDQSIDQLMTLGQLPGFASGSFELFSNVRTQIVHGGSAVSESDLLSAIDSGLTLLRVLYAIPLEQNTVYHPGVSVYSDAACTQLIPDAKGLILQTTSPEGGIKSFRIYPTTRTDYVKGEHVTWEWNLQKIWGPAWYRDPDGDKIKAAWTSSAEFVGRDLEKLASP